VDLLYVIDPSAEEPIMLLDDDIGYDQETGTGISGARFTRELLFLDTLNKSRIHIWINSQGGSVVDAEQIVATILKTKTKVDTHNLGLCASAAGPIFLAGCKRYMMPHATFMMHPVSGVTDPKAYESFTNTVLKMLSGRLDLSEGVIRQMMNETTWLTADQCEKLGMCIKENASELNKPRKVFDPNNVAECYQDFKTVVNKLIDEQKPKNIIQMKQVTNKLNLNEAANETAIVAEIEKIENRAKVAEGKLNTQEAENKVKVDALNKQVSELTEAKNKAEQSLKDIENKATEEKATKLKAEAKNLIDEGVKAGRIKNDADVIAKFTKLAETDLETTKEAIAAMPVNKAMPIQKAKEGEVVRPYNAAGIMAEIALREKQTKI
jgi:ATP-dependent Clp protease protease subunit